MAGGNNNCVYPPLICLYAIQINSEIVPKQTIWIKRTCQKVAKIYIVPLTPPTKKGNRHWYPLHQRIIWMHAHDIAMQILIQTAFIQMRQCPKVVRAVLLSYLMSGSLWWGCFLDFFANSTGVEMTAGCGSSAAISSSPKMAACWEKSMSCMKDMLRFSVRSRSCGQIKKSPL